MTRARLLAALAAAALAAPALAEKADRDKPTHIEANRMSADDAKRLNIFEGDVVLTKGTITVRGDRIVVRQDADGFQHSVATGRPVTFRQRQDPKEGKDPVWVDGEALRIEIDDRKESIELFESARVTRDGDEVRGDYIFVDQRTEFFRVSGGKDAPQGRVRAVIQPKTKPEAKPEAKPAAPPPKPAAR